MSRKRSTQLARQVSSGRSSLAFLTLPVTHFFQHICVRLCVSAAPNGDGQPDDGRAWRPSGQAARRSLTRLDVRALLLVREELAQLGLVLVVELLEVEILDAGLRGVHAGLRPGLGRGSVSSSSSPLADGGAGSDGRERLRSYEGDFG